MLPPLIRRQILEELERQVDEYDWQLLKSNLDEKEPVLDYILKLPLPYPEIKKLTG
jgi:hypothetical protein